MSGSGGLPSLKDHLDEPMNLMMSRHASLRPEEGHAYVAAESSRRRWLADGKPTAPAMHAVRPPEPAQPLASLRPEAFDLEDRPTPVCPPPERIVRGAGCRRAALVPLDGPLAGKAIELSDPLRLGRGREADLRVDDDEVSRLHAEVRHEGAEWVLVDLGSRNGTAVQGKACSRRVLRDGDFIQIGRGTTYRFALMDEQQEALLLRLYESSVRDLLTGAYNRRHFDERLTSEIAYAVRHGSRLGLLLFDLDHFKRVNDTHGHRARAAVLRYVAGAVSSRRRAADVFARYGGEECAGIRRGVDRRGAARAGERLRGTIAGNAAVFEGVLIPATISVGCAAIECCGERTAEALVEVADRRLYLAKRGGRNRVIAEP